MIFLKFSFWCLLIGKQYNVHENKEVLVNLAMALTLSRFFMAPLSVMLYLYHAEFGLSVLTATIFMIALLVIIEVSDILDGYIARKRHQVTDLGKILDPLADSFVRLTLFFSFSKGLVQLPFFLVLIFFYRELFVYGLRILLAIKGKVLSARSSGKIKTVLQGIGSFVIMLMQLFYLLDYLSFATFHKWAIGLMSAIAIYTIYSLFEYFYCHRSEIKEFLVIPSVKKMSIRSRYKK